MNAVVKIAIAAVAVAVVAVVGINLLSAGNGPRAGIAVSPSSAPSPTFQPSPSAGAAVVFPPAGELAIGRHAVTIDGVSFSFEVKMPDWFSNPSNTGGWIQRGADNATTPAWMPMWSVDNVYSDPCAHTELSPAVGLTAADLAAALSMIPGTDAIGPTDITVGGLPAKRVVLTVRSDVGCDAEDFYLWLEQGSGPRYPSLLPTTIRVWIVDVDGERIFIESELLAGAAPELDQEIDQIVESIRFE
jgi:hypothetical protein